MNEYDVIDENNGYAEIRLSWLTCVAGKKIREKSWTCNRHEWLPYVTGICVYTEVMAVCFPLLIYK